MQNNQPRRKGFSFLSFFLGMLFGIILLVGSIAGVAYYALSGKIDNVLGMVGVDNSKDENGNNKVINTDKENGGVETLLELVAKVGELVSDSSNLSVGSVENLIPAVGGLVDGLHGAISGYVPVEREEFTAVKFSEFGTFVQGKVLEIRPATLFDTLGMSGMLDNPIMQLVFVGKEADYVVIDEVKYPAHYDVFELSDGKYLRVGDGAELPEQYAEYVAEVHGEYRLNYYFVGEECYVADKDLQPVTPTARTADGTVYSLYTPEYGKLSGNYYYDGETKVEVTPVTLGTLSNGGFDALNDVYLTELLKSDDALAEKVLGDISLGDLMNGTVDISSVIKDLRLAEIMDISATDKIMSRLIYNIYDITPAEAGAGYAYTGKYKLPDGDGTNDPVCYIEVKEGTAVISKAYYGNNVEILSLSVSELQKGLNIDDLKIGELMDVNGNMILENLKDCTIKDLPTAIQQLSINEIYYEEIYKVKEVTDDDGTVLQEEIPAELKLAVAGTPANDKQIKFNSDYLYYEDAQGKNLVKLEGSELGKLTEAQFKAGVAEGKTYYTYGEAQGMWKILLYKTTGEGESKTSTEMAYSLEKLTDMIANVSNNIQGTTLYTLHDNGIITFNKRTDLDLVVYKGADGEKDTTLGELELTEALSYLVGVLGATQKA